MNTYGDVITRVRAELVDGYGGQRVRDWANAARDEFAASVQTRSSTENDNATQVVTTGRTMNVAPGLVLSTDRVEWRGNTYEVGGLQDQYQGGRYDHDEVALEVVVEAST